MSTQTSTLDGVPGAAHPRVAGPGMPPLRLLPAVPPEQATNEEFERALLAFDPEDDLAQIIPMPSTIPQLVRAAITQALGDQFGFADELDDWLHGPNDALAGATPFECVVAGDGIAVLVALLGPGDHPELRGLISASGPLSGAALHLMR